MIATEWFSARNLLTGLPDETASSYNQYSHNRSPVSAGVC